MANLIPNPGFEEDPIRNEEGGFWRLRIWGTGTVIPADPFIVETVDVYEGLRAMRVHVEQTGYLSFVVSQILTPTLFVPNETYQLRLAYKSDMPLTLGFQGSKGGTVNLDVSITLPASPNWTVSEWLTFTIPPEGCDYIQMVVFQTAQIGDYIVDAFELISTVAPITHVVTLDSSPTGVAYTSPSGVAPFTVNVDDGASLAVQVPSEIEV